jgi:N-acetylglucosamine repressor
LRHLNARDVIAALQEHGPLSRAEISRRTGISGPTVTRAVAHLLDAGLLEEHGLHQPGLGRPGMTLRLASRSVSVLGLVVGMEHCDLVAAGLDGELRPDLKRRLPTPRRYPDLVRAIGRHARELAGADDTTVLGLGVSVPGLLNRRQGRTVISPNLHQTDGQQLGEDLKRELGWDVALLQESHALCLAERTYGAARGADDFAMIDISEGLGLGVVHGGRFVEGHSGLAGELGHVTAVLDGKPCGCGNRGCLETEATDTALANAVSARLGRTLTVEKIVGEVQAGTLAIDAELGRVLDYLAVGCAAVINVFNPSKLFVYGRFLDADTGLWDQLLERTRRRALAPSMADCDMIRARGNKALGAVAGIIHRLTTGRAEELT